MALRAAAIILVLLGASLLLLDRLAPGPEQRREALGLAPPGAVAELPTGERLFRTNCAGCHATDLRGTALGPPLIHPIYRPDHHADLAIRMAVRNGVTAHHWQFGNMPPVAGINGEEIAHLVAFIRARQRAAGLIP